uniref:keratin, type I cytoskeletal 18 n=1 Tax=Pristiophorus japonicus TaxID=55135 RepID=UPI00398F415F
MPSITSGSSQRRSSSRAGPSFSSRSAQSSSSWARSPAVRSTSSRSSAILLGSTGALMAGGMMSASSSEKQTMQNLNNRLALYLEKVQFLDTSNRDLERKITALLEERKPVNKDINPMLAQAYSLNKQIHDLIMNNAAILLHIDNAKLSAEDFRMKMESESCVRQTVESDIDRLRRAKEEYDGSASALRNEGDMLSEELLFLKKNHQEEVNSLRALLKNNQVSVEVESVQGPDIAAIIAKVRADYEEVVTKNKVDAQAWYQSQVQLINTEVEQNSKVLDAAKAEFSSKRQTIQTLEIELETLKKQMIGLQNILGETEERYGMDYHKLYKIVSKLEADMLKIRNDMLQKKEDYEALMKSKLTLEAELCEYRRLLTGEMSIKAPPRPPTPPPEVTTRKIIKVITTTLVDGKIVDESSEVEEFNSLN